MKKVNLPALLLILFLSACAPPSSSALLSPTAVFTPDASATLHAHPVQARRLEPGVQCPSAHGKQLNATAGVVLGNGPVYVGGLSENGVLNVAFPPATETPFYGNAWSGARVVWFIDPSYRGAVLIRGTRLDGPDVVRFGGGSEPLSDLYIPAASTATSPGWRSQAIYARFFEPGCYMYQVDGANFSESIIFAVQAQP